MAQVTESLIEMWLRQTDDGSRPQYTVNEFRQLCYAWRELQRLRAEKETRAESEKVACRCPTNWCRLEPDNGAEQCPDLEPHEVCAYRQR